jgi:hypothetical protein
VLRSICNLVGPGRTGWGTGWRGGKGRRGSERQVPWKVGGDIVPLRFGTQTTKPDLLPPHLAATRARDYDLCLNLSRLVFFSPFLLSSPYTTHRILTTSPPLNLLWHSWTRPRPSLSIAREHDPRRKRFFIQHGRFGTPTSHIMPAAEGSPRTLYDKVFQAHVVDEKLDGTVLLYIGMS